MMSNHESAAEELAAMKARLVMLIAQLEDLSVQPGVVVDPLSVLRIAQWVLDGVIRATPRETIDARCKHIKDMPQTGGQMRMVFVEVVTKRTNDDSAIGAG